MSQTGYKKTPTVISGILYTEDEYNGAVIDSSRWAAFLATGQPFYYAGAVNFMVGCEPRRSRAFWTICDFPARHKNIIGNG